MPKQKEKEELTKCPICHAYFVKPGEICNNCKKNKGEEVKEEVKEEEEEE